LSMSFGPELEFKLIYEGKVLGSVSAKYGWTVIFRQTILCVVSFGSSFIVTRSLCHCDHIGLEAASFTGIPEKLAMLASIHAWFYLIILNSTFT
jgi:hypothetical protein